MSWKPLTKSISGSELTALSQSDAHSAVHCWAEWNGHDRSMDKAIQELIPRFEGWVDFYSCELDLEENWDWLKQMEVVQVPSIVILSPGRPQSVIVGCREKIDLARLILNAISGPEEPSLWQLIWQKIR